MVIEREVFEASRRSAGVTEASVPCVGARDACLVFVVAGGC